MPVFLKWTSIPNQFDLIRIGFILEPCFQLKMKNTAILFLGFFTFSLSLFAQNSPDCNVIADNGSSYEVCHGNVTFIATPCNTCTFDWAFSVGDSVVSGLGTHQVEVYIPRGKTFYNFDIIVTDTVTNQYCAYVYNFDVDPFAGQTNLWNSSPAQDTSMCSGAPNRIWYSYTDSIYFGNPVQHYDDLYIRVYRDGNRVLNNWTPPYTNPTTFRDIYSAGLSSTHPIFSVTGEYEVCAYWVDDDNLMCPLFDCVTHYVDAGEGVDIYVGNQNPDRDTFCLGEIETFVARGWTYDSVYWSPMNGNNSLTQLPANPAVATVQWNQTGLDTLIVQSTPACSTAAPYSDTLIVYVSSNTLTSTPNLGADTTICSANDTLNLTPGNFSTYNWSTGDQSAALTANQPGIYWVEVGDSNQCRGVDSIIVTLGPSLPVQIPDTQFCAGDSVQLSAGYPNGVLWNNGQTTPTITLDSAGMYSVVVTPNTGCPGSDNFTVQSVPNPVPNLGADTLICGPVDSLVLTVPGYTQYAWSNGGQNASITIQTSGVYSLLVTDQNGCQGQDSIEVTINPPLSVSIPDTQFCAGDSVQLNAGYPNGVLWSNGQTTPSISLDAAGTYWVEVTPPIGCPGADTFLVQSLANPLPNLGPDTHICLMDSLTLAVPGYAQYAWSNGGQNASITVHSSGVYSVLVTDQNGCQGTDSIALGIGTPIPVTVPDTQFCAGSSVLVSAGYPSGVRWSNGQTTPTVLLNSAGTYWVEVTPAFGCPGVDTFVVQTLVNPTPTLGPDTLVCFPTDSLTLNLPGYSQYAWSTGSQNSSITIQNSGTYSVLVTDQNGCQGSDSIVVTFSTFPGDPFSQDTLWSCQGDSLILSVNSPWQVANWSTGATANSITVSQPGWYWVNVFSPDNCPFQDSIRIENYPPLSPNFSYGTSFLTVQFQNQTTGQISNFWSFGDGNPSSVVSPTHSYLNPGSYLVTLQVRGPNQCLYETSDSISIFGTSREADLTQGIKIFPNPASSSVNIAFEESRGGLISARLINLWGHEVRSETWQGLRAGDTFQFDITGLSTGQYLLLLTDGKQVYPFPVQVRRE